MIDNHMDAARLQAPGDPASLVFERIATPEPGPQEVLARVVAAAITRDELEWPEDRLPAIPSYELSGIVAAVGSEVGGGVAVGDDVFALTGFDRDGAAAEYIAVPQEIVAPKPGSLSHVECATLPLAALSAWQGLFDHGGLVSGQRVLIHGVGGVGAFAVQLARNRDAHVIVTTSPTNAQFARELGAHEVLSSTLAASDELAEPVDLVFDTAGGERLAHSSALVAHGGRLVSIAAEPAPHPERPDIHSRYFVVEPNREQLTEVAALADARKLQTRVAAVFPLVDARRAFERTTSGAHHGKIVLRVGGEIA